MDRSEGALLKPTSQYVRVLSIAGSDSGGGAGIQADLKTVAALGCYGMTAVTAITAQNTRGVLAVHAVPPRLVAQQIDAVVDDIGVDAVKIGMLHDAEAVRTVAAAIARHGFKHVVLDPVMVATSGDRLSDQGAVPVLVRELLPLASVVKPNLDEVGWLLGRAIDHEDKFEDAAQEMLGLGAKAVLLKGGHLQGSNVADLLFQRAELRRWWKHARIPTINTHGTGCSLSSAIACGLGEGLTLELAVDAAQRFVRNALTAGASIRTGNGHGPIDHGFAPLPSKLTGLGA